MAFFQKIEKLISKRRGDAHFGLKSIFPVINSFGYHSDRSFKYDVTGRKGGQEKIGNI